MSDTALTIDLSKYKKPGETSKPTNSFTIDIGKYVDTSKDKKPIGVWEAMKRDTGQGVIERIPFIGGVYKFVEELGLGFALERKEKGKYEDEFIERRMRPQNAWADLFAVDTPEGRKNLYPNPDGTWSAATKESIIRYEESILDKEMENRKEEVDRGLTKPAQVIRGISELPAWGIEIWATGGLYTTGKKLALKGAEKLIKRKIKNKIIKGTIAWTGGTALRVGLGMPQRAAAAIAQRRVEWEETPEGDLKLVLSDENWATSIAKGYMSTFIQTGSEVLGGPLMRGLAKIPGVKRVATMPMMQMFFGRVQKEWLKRNAGKTADDFIMSMIEKGGYNGFIGELGEEWIAREFEAIVGTEDYGAGKDAPLKDRVWAATMQGIEQLPVESAVLLAPGMSANIADRFVNKYNESKGKKKRTEIMAELQEEAIAPPTLDQGTSIVTPISNQEVRVTNEKENIELLRDYTSRLIEFENNERTKKGIKITDEEYKAQAWVLENYDQARANFIERSMKEFGVPHVVSADIGKFAIPGMDSTKSIHYHEAASALSKARTVELLNDKTTLGKDGLILAGGAGVGKSGSIRDIKLDQNAYAIVIDTNLNKMDSAVKKIMQVLRSGRSVQIAYVHRDMLISFTKGVLPRVKVQNRIVPIVEHGRTHLGARETIDLLVKKYIDHPKVEFMYVDNTGLKGEQVRTTLEKIPQIGYTQSEIEAMLYQEVQNAVEEETITKQQAETFLEGSSYEGVEKLSVRGLAREEPKGKKEPAREKPVVKEVRTTSQKALDRIKELENRKDKIADLENTISEINTVYDLIKGKVRRFKDNFMKEELDTNYPKGFFVTDPNASTVDQVIDDLKQQGFGEFTLESLGEYVKAAKEETARLKEEISNLRPEYKRKADITMAKEKLHNIQMGIREGKITSLAEAKAAQNKLINILEKQTILDAKDRAKFLRLVKNVQSLQQLSDIMPKIMDRILALEIRADVNRLDKQIQKEIKNTKPYKRGAKRISRFEYNTNKMFDAIRDYNKMNQEQAQEEIGKIKGNSPLDLIKKRFLDLKIQGKKASPELFSQVLQDIQMMKEIGAAVKNDKDMMDKINRQDLVDEARVAMDKVEPGEKKAKTRIINFYRRGVSNIWSMLNSIMGQNLADKYNPEVAEQQKFTNIFYKNAEMIKQGEKILNTDSLMSKFEELSSKDYSMTDIKNRRYDLSKMEIMDIYNSIKNPLLAARYDNAFDAKQVSSIIDKLTPQEKAFADYLMDNVQGYRQVFNQLNIERYGRDLPFVEYYWPSTAEYQADIFDDIKIQGETPSAMKERVKSEKIIPRPVNVWRKAQKHINQGEHIKSVSRQYETLQRLFTDLNVKDDIQKKFGKGVYDTLMMQIDTISLNKMNQRMDAVSEAFQVALNNWVSAKIALNPTTFVRQLMSVGNYMENVKTTEWIKHFSEGVAHPKQTFDFMWNNAPYLEARFNRGYSEALSRAIEGAERINSKWGNYTEFLTSLVRSGDIGAIVYGGYGQVKADMAAGMSKEAAFDKFLKATLRSQQSPFSSSSSTFQNSRNPFARLFLAFKNTANQYSRKIFDAMISYSNGDISQAEFGKIMTIYGVIQPMMYVMAGMLTKELFRGIGGLLFGTKPEKEDPFTERMFDQIITQMVLNPINSIPVMDQIVRFHMRKLTGQKAWKMFSFPMLDDIGTAFSKFGKKDPTGKDILQGVGLLLEPITAAPINTFIRYYEYLFGKKGKRRV